jgi:hypothetical protein
MAIKQALLQPSLTLCITGNFELLSSRPRENAEEASE